MCVREGATEIRRDLRHAGRARKRLGRSEVMPNIVVGEHLVSELDVATIPNLFVEPPYQRLVLSDAHRSLLAAGSRLMIARPRRRECSRSYHGFALSKSLTRIPAKRSRATGPPYLPVASGLNRPVDSLLEQMQRTRTSERTFAYRECSGMSPERLGLPAVVAYARVRDEGLLWRRGRGELRR